MSREQKIISLDPIDRKKSKELGIIGRLLISRYSGGKPIKKMDDFGHYMFTGVQGSGKSTSCIWYAEKLIKKYKKKGYNIRLLSNIGIGELVSRQDLYKRIDEFNPNDKEIRIVIIDEIQTYFPKETRNKDTKALIDDLIAIFSQLRKRTTYILSTSQIYGRVDKSLREQCLYMINCKLNFNKTKLVNEFIPADDILCDELGRWAGKPKRIYVHGLQKLKYDTKKIIRC